MVADLLAREVVNRLKDGYHNERMIRASLRKIRTDTEFEKMFHTFDIDLQLVVIELLDRAAQVDTVKTLTRFMHQNKYKRGILSAWTYTDSSSKPVLYDGPGERPSAELVKRIRAFQAAYQKHNCEAVRYDTYTTMVVFIFLMRTVHGEDRMMEMLDYWTRNLEYFSYSRFEEIAKSWDNVKHLPIEWTFSITEID